MAQTHKAACVLLPWLLLPWLQVAKVEARGGVKYVILKSA